MPDIGANAVHTMEASIRIATTITQLSKEVLLAVLKVLQEKLNSGQISLKQLNRAASRRGASMTSVSLPDKDAQAVINDLRQAGVTFAVKREGDGIRLFFFASSAEIIKAALEETLKKNSREKEQPQAEAKSEQTQEKSTEQKTEEQQPSEPERTSKQPEQAPAEPEPQKEEPTQKEATQEPQKQTEQANPEPKRVPLYRQSAQYAHEHGEEQAYRNSIMENIKCKRAVEQVIADRYDGIRMPNAISHDVIDQFGVQRVALVLAASVVQNIRDGRFSRSNKEWATNEAGDVGEHARRYRVNTHPAVLDVFINDAREYIAQVKEQVVNVVETATAFTNDAKIMREGEEVPKSDEPPKEQTEAQTTQTDSAREQESAEAAPAQEIKADLPSFEDVLSEGVKLSQEYNAQHQQPCPPLERKEQTL